MANRVRFHSLVLAGFGRYDRPTRFRLDGRSCTFTSANELGKSTFQAGLLATLFGPPGVRAKAAAFQSRYRSWHGSIGFYGELDFSVNDEPWRIRQDFEALETTVWRVHDAAAPELRFHSKAKPSRSSGDAEQYARLLDDWLGLTDISFYEAMFTVSQESTLSTSWQVDPRIGTLVYGPAIERLATTLQELFGRFRDITRNTREFQITVGSHGERNGRSDGRLDDVVARIESQQKNLDGARQRVQAMAGYRTQLEELDVRDEQLRQDLADTERSLEAWNSWVELESRLNPAVESYERLRDLNDRCQQVTRPLAGIRTRLHTHLDLFDQAPPDLAERLEYHALLVQAAAESAERYESARDRESHLQAELVALHDSLTSEVGPFRERPALAEHVEELRLVHDEIDSVSSRLAELTRPEETSEQRAEWLRRREQLEPWRTVVNRGQQAVDDARVWLQSFGERHAEYEAACRMLESESRWLTECDRSIKQRQAERAELEQSRRREAEAIVATEIKARHAVDRARDRQAELAQSRRDLESRYIDFHSAPADLPVRWDQLREQSALRAVEQTRMAGAHAQVRNIERRVRWRRGLAVGGVFVVLLCVALDHRWPGLLAAASAAALVASLRWIYGVHALDLAEQRRIRQRHEAELLRLNRQCEQITAQIGSQFIVPPEREAEWRRLWPTYRRELEQLTADEQSLPATQQISEWMRLADGQRTRLARHQSETTDLLADLDEELRRVRAEYIRRQTERDRLEEETRAHVARFFGVTDAWAELPLGALPASWESVAMLVLAAAPSVRNAGELVSWCGTLQESDWIGFQERGRELTEIDELVAPDPVAVAAREAAERQARETLQSLQEQQALLLEAVEPFTAETDPAWLRERWAACTAAEQVIAERERLIDELPDVERLASEAARAAQDLGDANQVLAPFFERFGDDSASVASAMKEWSELQSQARQLEVDAATLLESSGYASLEELAHAAGMAEGLVGTIRGESRELLARANELWQAVDAAPELARQRASELERQRDSQQLTLDAMERDRAELVATLRQMDADPANDIPALEAELAELCRERGALEQQRNEIAAAFQESNRLMQELQRVERTALEGRMSAYFADFSRTTGRQVLLDDDLRIRLRNDDGKCYEPDQLSHGARDQLYLAVYLACAASFRLPFILDDPFVNCDSERLAAIRACWDRLIPDHQLILLSHNPQMASWAPSLEMREAA
jgi:uncharacterized protein YhaN